jgi:hypothetical protein
MWKCVETVPFWLRVIASLCRRYAALEQQMTGRSAGEQLVEPVPQGVVWMRFDDG